MQWYEHIRNALKCGEIYSHKELTNELKILKPNLADSTYHWAISSLVREGQIIRLGYDAYSSPDGSTKKEYDPLYSDLALEVLNQIKETYPYVTFTVFETVMMNDFLNHLIAQNTVFIQALRRKAVSMFSGFCRKKDIRMSCINQEKMILIYTGREMKSLLLTLFRKLH